MQHTRSHEIGRITLGAGVVQQKNQVPYGPLPGPRSMAARQTATARGRVPDRALAGQFPLPTQSSRSFLERPKAATVGAQIAGSGRGLTSRCPPSLLGFRAHQCDYLGPDIVQLGGGNLPFALGLAGHPIEALDLVG